MKPRRRAAWILALTASAAGLAFLAFPFLRPRAPPRPPAPAAAPAAATAPALVIAPEPSRPVPPRLAAGHLQIREFLGAGRYAEAAARFPAVLSELAREWGAGSADLAPYHYDFALAVKLAGRPRQCLEIASQGRRLWPGSLQLEALFLITTGELALAERSFPPELDEGLRRVLSPENLPRLRGLRIDPAALHALRAKLLETAGRTQEALSAAEDGLRLDSRNAALCELRARALLVFERSREAADVLRGLVSERRTEEREMLLAAALLGCGDAPEASGILERLLRERADRPGSAPVDPQTRSLRLLASRALLESGRTREARTLLEEVLLEEPESIRALQYLASSLDGPAREALHRRVRELFPYGRSLDEASKAQAAGFRSSSLFHRAQAALWLARPGEAAARLREAVKLSPRLSPLWVELARAQLLLGRGDLAERDLREGLALPEASAVLSPSLAAVLARGGRREEALKILHKEKPRQGGAGDPDAAAALAEAWLELGETATARLYLAGGGGEGADRRRLLLAGAAVIEGSEKEAWDLLEAGAGPGFFGALRHRALRGALHLRKDPTWSAEPGVEELDPSDLLDEPCLLLAGAGAAALREAREPLAKIHEGLRGRSGEGAAEGYRRLFSLYRELKARRKMRETAWQLLDLKPDGAEELRLAARTLARPEERVARMSVLWRARKALPGDLELEEWWREGCEFLGWDRR